MGVQIGKTFDSAHNAARLIQEAGFTDMHEQWLKIPVGTWPKDKVRRSMPDLSYKYRNPLISSMQRMKQIGMYSYYYCLEGCDGWSLFLLSNVLQWGMEEIQIFLAKLKNALNDPRTHSYFNV